jgi:hypothetical protein
MLTALRCARNRVPPSAKTNPSTAPVLESNTLSVRICWTSRPLLAPMADKAASPRRFVVVLLGGFAVFALLLAALGTYGGDLLFGQPTPPGNRYPHGAGRFACQRSALDSWRDLGPGSSGHRHRACRSFAVYAARRLASLRREPHGSSDLCENDGDAGRRRGVSRLSASPARSCHRTCELIASRVTSLHRIFLPRPERTSSTPSSAVVLCSSITGLISTTSREAMASVSAIISIARCASR